MLGKIVSYDAETKTGIIQCNSAQFSFDESAWNDEGEITEGLDVFFNQKRNKVLEIQSAEAYLPKGDPVKSRIVAGLLGMFLGFLGAGRFYLGFYKIGIFQLIVSVVTLGFGALWGFVDGVLILVKQVIKDAEGRPLK